jgi:hypothetical protein
MLTKPEKICQPQNLNLDHKTDALANSAKAQLLSILPNAKDEVDLSKQNYINETKD